MPDEVCKAELCGKIASWASYTISGSLIVGRDLINVLDQHAAAIGAVLGIATFIINWRYQVKAIECRCKVLGISPTNHDKHSHPHRRAGDIPQGIE